MTNCRCQNKNSLLLGYLFCNVSIDFIPFLSYSVFSNSLMLLINVYYFYILLLMEFPISSLSDLNPANAPENLSLQIFQSKSALLCFLCTVIASLSCYKITFSSWFFSINEIKQSSNKSIYFSAFILQLYKFCILTCLWITKCSPHQTSIRKICS